jgi:hypothetical protein
LEVKSHVKKVYPNILRNTFINRDDIWVGY